MFFPDQARSHAAIRLTIKRHDDAVDRAFSALGNGWRTFVCAGTREGGMVTRILKRGASCVVLTQNTHMPIEQTVMLPSAEAGELCSLFVQHGLAVPA
jgi:hypothetical protein